MGLDKDDIKALIAILQKGLVDDDTIVDDNQEPTSFVPKKTNKKRASTKKKDTENKFDSMAEYRMHKDDVLIDKKLNKLPPTQRARNYKPLKVKCRVCGKTENINPSLVESIERYKCNRCSTSAG